MSLSVCHFMVFMVLFVMKNVSLSFKRDYCSGMEEEMGALQCQKRTKEVSLRPKGC